jgi:orotate phosphoribosyltransferase
MDSIDYPRKIAEAILEVGAFTVDPKKPRQWSCLEYMPAYNDNRKLLRMYRKLVTDALVHVVKENDIEADVIAGTTSAGVPWATSLADRLDLPLIYVRGKKKEHGLQNIIEGILYPGDVVLTVDDVFSTGSSAFNAVQNIRSEGGICDWCISLFSYGFEEAEKKFKKGDCQIASVLYYPTLKQTAIELKKIDQEQIDVLNEWYPDPFNWGKKMAFRRL